MGAEWKGCVKDRSEGVEHVVNGCVKNGGWRERGEEFADGMKSPR
ncbi:MULTISPECIES: hypothetical protein [unclassified Bartonella]